MKFYVGSKQTGTYFKNEIRKTFAKNGGFVSLAEVKELFRDTPDDADIKYGWDEDSDIGKKLRIRQCRDGWYLYLPEPNAKICFDKKKEDNEKFKAVAAIEPPDIDVCVIETEIFEKLIDELVKFSMSVNDGLIKIYHGIDNYSNAYYYRDCTVKAKKSGRKEERQDRHALFHRWADLSKGVQQVVAIVEFDDGHIEQVQPDRIIFRNEEVEDGNDNHE